MEEMILCKQNKKTHGDLGAKCMEIDSQSVKLISEWFSNHNPFSMVNICVIRRIHIAGRN